MGALTSLATLGLDLALSQASQEAEESQLRTQRRQEVRRIKAADAEEQRRQQASLARRLAQERARAGAMGVGSTGGSIDAVLRGLSEESRALEAAREKETAARVANARDRFDSRGRRNLLEQASRWIGTTGRISGGLRGSGRSLLG